MEFKPSEIITIAAVLLLPIGAFTFIFWPGSYAAVVGLINSPVGLPVACAVGVVLAVAVFAIRRMGDRRRRPSDRDRYG
jgi:uncharacterized membrane protein